MDPQLVGQCLEDMTKEWVEGNDITNVSFLSTSSRAGLTDEGIKHFKSLKESTLSTYADSHNSMVNFLGCTGKLEDAEYLLQMMPSCLDASKESNTHSVLR